MRRPDGSPSWVARRLDEVRGRSAARHERDERGAIAVLVALLITVLMFPAALVLDIGLQRVGRSDMQALADVVVLDLVRELDGRTTSELRTPIAQAAERSRQRNSDTVGGDADIDVELGSLRTDGTFVPMQSGTPTAVKVTTSTDVDFAFDGLTGVESGGAQADAVAERVSNACYTVGSYAAQVSTGNSALLDMMLQKIGSSSRFNNGGVMQALSYQGLAASSVKLGDVAAGLNLGSVDQLAQSTVQLKSYYAAIASALRKDGKVANAQLLETMSAQANAGATVAVGRMMDIRSGAGAVADLRANVLDLVAGSLYVMNGTNFVSLPIAATLPGIANANGQVRLIQGPRLYCGPPGSAFTTGYGGSTEQLYASVTGTVSPTVKTISLPKIPGLTFADATVSAPLWSNLDTTLRIAPTESWLRSIRCGSSKGATIGVNNTLATVTMSTQISEASFETKLKIPGLLGNLVEVEAKVTVASVKPTITATFGRSGIVDINIDVPPMAFDTYYPTQSGQLSNSTVEIGGNVSVRAQSKVTILGVIQAGATIQLSTGDQSALARGVSEVVMKSLLDGSSSGSLANTLITPLLGLAGVDLGGSDVSLLGSPALGCGFPALRN